MWGMGIFLVIERLTPYSAQIYNMVDIGYYFTDTASHFFNPDTHFSTFFLWVCVILLNFTTAYCQNKAMSTPHWVYYIQLSLFPIIYLAGRESTIYLHQREANGVARFDNQGNDRSLIAWNE